MTPATWPATWPPNAPPRLEKGQKGEASGGVFGTLDFFILFSNGAMVENFQAKMERLLLCLSNDYPTHPFSSALREDFLV